MNYLYCGLGSDLNIGNCKSISIVAAVVMNYLQSQQEGIEKKIYSNIRLHGIPHRQLTPKNISEVLEVENALVILDEIHAIVHKNHKIHEGCTKHSVPGLCYRLSEFFRQTRKRAIDTYSSAQTYEDVPYQFRTVMQQTILCQKYNVCNGKLAKCNKDRCPPDHIHYVKQTDRKTLKPILVFEIAPYYDMYNSEEIVSGWISYD